MKIAVTSVGNDLSSEIDPRFGRAKQFILYDTESGEYESVDNRQNVMAAQGAGIQAAEAISELKADVLITGHCGPRAFGALKAAGVKIIVGATGTVEEAIELFVKGKLGEAQVPDVEGHWV